MRTESVVYTLAGMCFGIILGWLLGVQAGGGRATGAALTPAAAPAANQNTAQDSPTASSGQAPVLDEARVQALTTIMQSDPKNAGAAVQLGNVYFDAERWDDAIKWYRTAVDIDPGNADASTDLGVSLYYTNKTDEALAQFETSLKIDPKHTKTLLNKGIVLAFGRQDIRGATEVWKQVVSLAPDSPEGQAARRALEGVAQPGHAGDGAPAASNP
jgi:tetratricopeptide (TPR) repeat protein